MGEESKLAGKTCMNTPNAVLADGDLYCRLMPQWERRELNE